tara:strand:- start:622 stop:804 length:183 start_codon:yes stop_codon:yes gene_type:complete
MNNPQNFYKTSKEERKLLWTLRDVIKQENEVDGTNLSYREFLQELINDYIAYVNNIKLNQ